LFGDKREKTFDGEKSTKVFDGKKAYKIGDGKEARRCPCSNRRKIEEVRSIFEERGWKYIIELEPDKPEDITDLEILLNPGKPMIAENKVGRNEPCPCGSEKIQKVLWSISPPPIRDLGGRQASLVCCQRVFGTLPRSDGRSSRRNPFEPGRVHKMDGAIFMDEDANNHYPPCWRSVMLQMQTRSYGSPVFLKKGARFLP